MSIRHAFLLPEDSVLCVTPSLLVVLDEAAPRCMPVHEAVDRYASVLEQLVLNGGVAKNKFNKACEKLDKLAIADALVVHRTMLVAAKTNVDVLNAFERAVTHVFADMSAVTPEYAYGMIRTYKIVPFTPACSNDFATEVLKNADIREFNRMRAGAHAGTKRLIEKKA